MIFVSRFRNQIQMLEEFTGIKKRRRNENKGQKIKRNRKRNAEKNTERLLIRYQCIDYRNCDSAIQWEFIIQ